ncbi:uncharacterized protein [Triticum aestivum]|uniref:uncharacterized protein n=1 Tax=Triticum aestivum TaxID=4565 RepID=UPI001D023205|nr:uncharacterized protein LOC123090035 [Triticum aestivum]
MPEALPHETPIDILEVGSELTERDIGFVQGAWPHEGATVCQHKGLGRRRHRHVGWHHRQGGRLFPQDELLFVHEFFLPIQVLADLAKSLPLGHGIHSIYIPHLLLFRLLANFCLPVPVSPGSDLAGVRRCRSISPVVSVDAEGKHPSECFDLRPDEHHRRRSSRTSRTLAQGPVVPEDVLEFDVSLLASSCSPRAREAFPATPASNPSRAAAVSFNSGRPTLFLSDCPECEADRN